MTLRIFFLLDAVDIDDDDEHEKLLWLRQLLLCLFFCFFAFLQQFLHSGNYFAETKKNLSSRNLDKNQGRFDDYEMKRKTQEKKGSKMTIQMEDSVWNELEKEVVESFNVF